jgi:hypothetical protein
MTLIEFQEFVESLCHYKNTLRKNVMRHQIFNRRFVYNLAIQRNETFYHALVTFHEYGKQANTIAAPDYTFHTNFFKWLGNQRIIQNYDLNLFTISVIYKYRHIKMHTLKPPKEVPWMVITTSCIRFNSSVNSTSPQANVNRSTALVPSDYPIQYSWEHNLTTMSWSTLEKKVFTSSV